MAHHKGDDLLKVGIEGFAIIGTHFVRRSGKPYAPRKTCAPQKPATSTQMNTAAKVRRPMEAQAYHAARLSATKATAPMAHEATVLPDLNMF